MLLKWTEDASIILPADEGKVGVSGVLKKLKMFSANHTVNEAAERHTTQ